MELFYASNAGPGMITLEGEEARHCVKVLRKRPGDRINVIDGRGNMFLCSIVSSPDGRTVVTEVLETTPAWHARPYKLTMAVSPTKNNDRYEWFAEKATELGVDSIVPVLGEHSERRVFSTERIGRIVVAAAKQSLKAGLPAVSEPLTVRDFILDSSRDAAGGTLKLIACCFEGEDKRRDIVQALEAFQGRDVVVLIGPEGDFSPAELDLALQNGFVPVHLGPSRLRTETAAVTAVAAVYFKYMALSDAHRNHI